MCSRRTRSRRSSSSSASSRSSSPVTAARTSRQNVRPTTAATRTCERSAARQRVEPRVDRRRHGDRQGARRRPVRERRQRAPRRRAGCPRRARRAGRRRRPASRRRRARAAIASTSAAASGPRTRLVCAGSRAPHGRSSSSSGRVSAMHGAAGLAQLGAEVLDQVELARRGPVDVLVDDEHRPLGAEALEHPPQRQEEEALGDDRSVRGEPEEEGEVARRCPPPRRAAAALRRPRRASPGRRARGRSRRCRMPAGRAGRRRGTRCAPRTARSGRAGRAPPAACDLGPDLADERDLPMPGGPDHGDERAVGARAIACRQIERIEVELARAADEAARAVPAAPPARGAAGRASQASTGAAFPFALDRRAGPRTRRRGASHGCVSAARRRAGPAGAAACSRAAVLTTSPIANASPASGRPIADERLARVHCRAGGERRPAPSCSSSTALSTRRPARTARSASSPCGERGAEHRHHRVADELLEPPAVRLDLLAAPPRGSGVRVSRTSSGSASLGGGGEALQVDEEDGDELSLLRGGRGRRATRHTLRAEARLGVGARGRSARRPAPHGASIPTRRVSVPRLVRLVTKCYKATVAGSIPRRDHARDDRRRPRPRTTAAYDVAIVGAGYVGVPLAQVFAEAGRSVVLVEVDAARVDQLNRGESYIEDVPSELLGEPRPRPRPRRHDGLRRAPRYGRDPDRAADAALEAARARPLDRARRRRPDRPPAAARAPRRPRVDDVPGHDARRAPARPRARVRPPRRRGLPPRLLARAGRPRPGRLDDEDRPEGRRRRSTRRRPTPRPRSTARRSTPSTASRRPRPPSSRSSWRTSSARSTSRSSTSSRSSATGWRSTSGRSSTRPPRSRSASCRSSPARASAGTASRSTPSTSPGRPASTTSRRASSSSRARSTRTCRTTAARASPRRSTTAPASRSQERGCSCSAWPTSPTSRTGASRRP